MGRETPSTSEKIKKPIMFSIENNRHKNIFVTTLEKKNFFCIYGQTTPSYVKKIVLFFFIEPAVFEIFLIQFFRHFFRSFLSLHFYTSLHQTPENYYTPSFKILPLLNPEIQKTEFTNFPLFEGKKRLSDESNVQYGNQCFKQKILMTYYECNK